MHYSQKDLFIKAHQLSKDMLNADKNKLQSELFKQAHALAKQIRLENQAYRQAFGIAYKRLVAEHKAKRAASFKTATYTPTFEAIGFSDEIVGFDIVKRQASQNDFRLINEIVKDVKNNWQWLTLSFILFAVCLFSVITIN